MLTGLIVGVGSSVIGFLNMLRVMLSVFQLSKKRKNLKDLKKSQLHLSLGKVQQGFWLKLGHPTTPLFCQYIDPSGPL